MQIKVQDFIAKIEQEDYQQDRLLAKSSADVIKDVSAFLAPLLTKVEAAVSKNKLAAARLLIGDGAGQITLSLETGIINLPFANIKKVDNFFDDITQTVPVIIYFIAQGQGLNASNFKIMRIAPAASLTQPGVKEAVMTAALDALTQIEFNRAQEEKD